MAKTFVLESLTGIITMIKYNRVPISSATSNVSKYDQSLFRNLHRFMSTLYHSNKKMLTVKSNHSGEYNPKRTAFIR